MQLEDPDWKAVYGEIEFECGHWSVFENAIDMAHIHYLHADSFGNKVRWPACLYHHHLRCAASPTSQGSTAH